MKSQHLILALVMMVMAVVSGCATGGGGSGNKNSRGTLTAATSEAAQGQPAEEPKGRGEGRTRTKNEVYETPYAEEPDDDDGGGVLDAVGGFVWGLFSGDDDEPEYTYPPANQPPDTPANADYNEFGLPADENETQEKTTRAKGEKSQGPQPKSMIFWYSPSWLAGDAIQGFSNFSLLYSVNKSRKVRVHVGPYYGVGSIGNQGNLRAGLESIAEWGVDTGLRMYLNPENQGRELYGLAGLRLGFMDWVYTNPLELPNGAGGMETIPDDGVGVFTPYLGLGTSFLKAGKFQVGVSFTLGLRMTLEETFKGFQNDVFPTVGEYRLNMEASYFF